MNRVEAVRSIVFRSRELFRPHLPTKCVRQSSFADKFEYSPKKLPHMAKIFVFEIKRCSKLHYSVAQLQLVLNLFLPFDKF